MSFLRCSPEGLDLVRELELKSRLVEVLGR